MSRGVVRLLYAGLLALSLGLLAQSPPPPALGVGEGAPTSAILNAFIQAFFRGGFSGLVTVPPRDKVHRNGPGYVQDFNAASSLQSYLLAKPDTPASTLEGAIDTFQMCCQILELHTTIGSFTAKIGYPVTDAFSGTPSTVDGSEITQQNFQGGHVIILYLSGSNAGQAFFIRPPYVDPWRATPTLALPIGQERDTTSSLTTTGIQQDFQGGTIVQITSGTRKDQIYAVSGPIFRRYHAIGEGRSALGYRVGAEFTVAGRQRQTFEVGYIDYVPGAPAAVEHTPVVSVIIDDAPLTLQVGNVAQRTAGVYDTRGAPATDVPITWTTSN